MKCRYCGGEVGLEEKVCPYCGRPNEQAEKHHREMALFRRRYAQTEAEVTGKADRYARVLPRLIALFLMLIVTVMMAVVTEQAYSIPGEMRRHEAEKNAEAVCAELDAYLAARDYVAFASASSYYDLRSYEEPFERYSDIRWVAESYKNCLLTLEEVFLHGDRESWLRYEASADILRFARDLDDFCDNITRMESREPSPQARAYAEDMRETVYGAMEVYLGIGEEERESFLALSENRKAAYLEEVLLDAEA